MSSDSTSNQPQKRVRVFISGRVQGVGFRQFTQRQARGLNVRGWVRNLGDGRVEALFEGPEDAVEKAIAWCRVGPPAGHVRHVAVHEEAPAGGLTSFKIRW